MPDSLKEGEAGKYPGHVFMYDDGIKALSAAIVLQALKDYKTLLKKKQSTLDVERFFNSAWCEMLISVIVDHDRLLSHVKFIKEIMQ